MQKTAKPAPNEFAADALKGGFQITKGVTDRFRPFEVMAAIRRHLALDWADMDPEDQHANLCAAMEDGGRVLGAYRVHVTREQICDLWVITEADRSMTTALLPDEY